MNTGIGRIIVGVLFVGLGAYRLSTYRSDGVKIIGVILVLYGLFSIGHGIYKMTKGQSGRLINDTKKEEDETLDNDV